MRIVFFSHQQISFFRLFFFKFDNSVVIIKIDNEETHHRSSDIRVYFPFRNKLFYLLCKRTH